MKKKLADEIGKAYIRLHQSQWISVLDRLPDKSGHYLVTVNDNKEIFVTSDDFFLGYLWDDFGDDVIAWMPLPEPYKKGV